MKVIHVSTGYHFGGASIACKRLVEAQRNAGIDASILTQEPGDFPPYVFSTTTDNFKKKLNLFRLAFEKIILALYLKSKEGRFQYSLSNTGERITLHPKFREADIIHLHWTNNGFLSLEELRRIVNTGKKIVWTMHDIWTFTGGCHIAANCVNYTKDCRECFYLSRGFSNSISNRQQKFKESIYANNEIQFIAPSIWQLNRAKSSSLLGGQSIHKIHNAINYKIDLPDKDEARRNLKLPADKKIILFGAYNISVNHKGIKYLLEALTFLKDKNEIELMIFGRVSEELHSLGIKMHETGYISSEDHMYKLYRAADVLVVPSIEDNLPNTILESFVCQTPVVAFKTGGIPEIIDHKENGYLAEYKNSKDLAAGIEWCLFNNNKNRLGRNAMEKIRRCFSTEVIAKEFSEFYSNL